MVGLELFLLILQIIIALILIILVLLQKSDGDSLSGIGSGSGGLNSVVSSKSSASIISKATMILIGFFMLNCLILASLSNVKSKAIEKDLEKIIEEQKGDSSKNEQIIDDKEVNKENQASDSQLNSSKNSEKLNDKKTKSPKTPIIPSIE